MSLMKRLEKRRGEIAAEMALISATAGGFNRGFSGGELTRRKALAKDLKAISWKIEEARAADDLAARVASATPVGLFDF